VQDGISYLDQISYLEKFYMCGVQWAAQRMSSHKCQILHFHMDIGILQVTFNWLHEANLRFGVSIVTWIIVTLHKGHAPQIYACSNRSCYTENQISSLITDQTVVTDLR
jgi:hypothetical protein